MIRNFTNITLALLLLSSCSGRDADQYNPSNCSGDTNFILNRSCQKVSWDSLPIMLVFDETITPEMKETIAQAGDVWERATGKDFFSFHELNGASADDFNIITITPEHQWEGDSAKENAKTFWASHNQTIVSMDVHINERILSPDEDGRMVDLLSVMIHELGHVLGLAHDAENTQSVMYSRLGINEVVRQLDQLDIDRVNSLY